MKSIRCPLDQHVPRKVKKTQVAQSAGVRPPSEVICREGAQPCGSSSDEADGVSEDHAVGGHFAPRSAPF